VTKTDKPVKHGAWVGDEAEQEARESIVRSEQYVVV
jgi:hypothetical protein